ncbi:MAG: cation transporter [Myxococcales bacterium]|nr:cation transporter [Myxococcales bacterium]
MGLGHHHGHGHSHDHDDGHGHGHGHDHTHGASERALWIALVLNAVLLVVEVVVGLISGSLALLADAGHMASDVGALGLALAAQRLAKRRTRSADYTFGLRRVPVIGALINAATLGAIVVLVVREAIGRLFAPAPVTGMPVLIAGAVGLFVNVFSAWFLHRSGDRSVNIRGAVLHLVADALGSVAAVSAAVVIMVTGWTPIDPILALIVALLIGFSSVGLLRDTVRILLQRAPHGVDVSAMRSKLLELDYVAAIDDFHCWELNSDERIISAILRTPGDPTLSELDARSAAIRELIACQHTTIQWRRADAAHEGCGHEHHDHDHDHDHHDHDEAQKT